MENKDYLTFTHPNCCDPALTVIERCFDGNANFLKVTVPGVGSSMVFEKATLIVNKVDNCNDTGCGLPFKGSAESPFLGYILLMGKMFYVAEAATGLSNNRFKNTLEVKFNNTTIDGNSYATTQELYDAIMAVVADCDCTCGDEVLPCDSIVSDLTWDGEGEEYQLIFHVGTSIGETVQLEVFNEEEIIAYTSEAVDVEEGATIVLPGESLSAISPGNTFRFYVRNGDTECFSDVPVVVGGEAIANNEEEIEVDLEDYFTAAIGACAGVSEYLLFYGTYTPGAAIVDGVLVIQPDETDPVDEIIGNLGLARICDGVLDSIVLVNIGYEAIVRPEGLRISFNNIANMPVGITDATDHTEWNTLFNLPVNGTAFTSAYVETNDVVLVGGSNITLEDELFKTNTDIVYVADETGCVVVAGIECFNGCSNVTGFSLPALTTTLGSSMVGGVFGDCTSVIVFNLPALANAQFACFSGCTSVTTFNLALCVTISDYCFNGCSSATLFNLPSCTALGSTSGANGVFDGISGNIITVNVPLALATADGGINPDGDLVALAAANTETINYV